MTNKESGPLRNLFLQQAVTIILNSKEFSTTVATKTTFWPSVIITVRNSESTERSLKLRNGLMTLDHVSNRV